MWLQVVHGSNLSNKVRKDAYLVSTKEIARINVNYNINTTPENILYLLFQKTQTRLIYLLTTSFRPIKRTIENLLRKLNFGEYKY